MWEVASVENFKGFQVQRSLDNKEFLDTQWIASKGDDAKLYSILDRDVEFNQRYYYRLKMVDLDDTTSLSMIETAIIESTDNQSITIFPNPVRHQLHIKSTHDFEKAHIFILSKNGEPIYDNENWNGTNLTIDASNFAEGMYVVQAVVGRQVTTQKFVKMGR